MKFKNLLAIVFVFTYIFTFAQVDTKTINIYSDAEFKSQNKEKITITAKKINNKFNYSKFGLSVINNSDKYLMYTKSKLVFDFGDKQFSPKGGRRIISPGKKTIYATQKVDGDYNFLVKEFTIIPNGISTFPDEGEVLNAPVFQLPASKNEFRVGNFKVNMIAVKQKTKVTSVKFTVLYVGDKIGLVHPARAVLRLEDGKEFANAKSKDKTKILFKNDSKKFTLVYKVPAKIADMQFATLNIDWKDVFMETEATPIKFSPAKIKLDEELTKKKNK